MDELNDVDDQEFRRMLARHDEPLALTRGPLQVALPTTAPRLALLHERRRQRRRLIWQGVLAALVGALLALGAWSVLVDSSLPARLLGGTGLDRVLLLLTLLAKPLLATLAANGPTTIIVGLLLLVVGGVLWWQWLHRVEADPFVQVQR